jgi:predicted small lipoprotein YifL
VTVLLPPCLRLLLVALLVLGIAGCGRRGELDPPPRASLPAPDAEPGQPAPAATSRSTVPRQRLPIDWLLD